MDQTLGIDLSQTPLTTVETSVIITPLTPLLERGGVTQEELKTALGLDSSIELTSLNLLSDTSSDVSAVAQAGQSILVLLSTFQTAAFETALSHGTPITTEAAYQTAIDVVSSALTAGPIDLINVDVLRGLYDDLMLDLPEFSTLETRRFVTDTLESLIRAIEGEGSAEGALVYAFTKFREDISAIIGTQSVEAFDDLVNDDPTFAFLNSFAEFGILEQTLPAAGQTEYTQTDFFEIVRGTSTDFTATDFLENDVLLRPVESVDILTIEVLNPDNLDIVSDFNTQSDILTLSPGGDRQGTLQIIYTFQPDDGPVAQGLALMNVVAPEEAPVADDDVFAVPSNVETLLPVFDNDMNDSLGQFNITRINGMNIPTDGPVVLASGVTLETNIFVGITIDPRGAYPDLLPGESVTETFTYLLRNLNGTTDEAQVTVTIDGVREALPVLNADVSLQEDSAILRITDQIILGDGTETDDIVIDSVNGTGALLGLGIAGSYGSFILEADGQYQYTLTPGLVDAEDLVAGETLEERFSFTGTDTLGNVIDQDFVLTIVGANDPGTFIFDRGTGARGGDATSTGTGEGIIASDGVLYIAGLNGTLIRFDLETGTNLDPLLLGDSLGGMTISPDRTKLYITEDGDTGNDATARFFVVDLVNEAVQSVDVPVSGGAFNSFDIAALSDGTIALSVFDPTISPNQQGPFFFDAETFAPVSRGVDDTAILITPSTSGRYALFETVGSSSADIALYDAQIGSVIARTDGITLGEETGTLSSESTNGLASISEAAELIVIAASSTLIVLDFDLKQVVDLAPTLANNTGSELFETNVAGAVFSADGSQLFVVDAISDTIKVLRTDTFEIQYSLSTGANVAEFDTTIIPPNLVLSDDGFELALLTGTRFEVFTFAEGDDGLLVPVLEVEENTSLVAEFNILVGDTEGLGTVTLVNGDDVSAFDFTVEENGLTFTDAPDFEAPSDGDGDNIYEIDLLSIDASGAQKLQPVFIKVLDVDETSTTMMLSSAAIDPVIEFGEDGRASLAATQLSSFDLVEGAEMLDLPIA